MIQIDNWMILASAFSFFVICIIYLIYFIISRKLFPETLEFNREINPKESITISKIDGSGIVKKIKLKTTERSGLLMDIIADQTSFINFSIDKNGRLEDKNSELQKETLSVEINLNQKFESNFTIFIQNETDNLSSLNGNVNYEIRKSLKTTLRAILSDLK